MKRFLLVLTVAMFVFCAAASAEVLEGNYGCCMGDNVKWRLDTDTGELRLCGRGETPDYWHFTVTTQLERYRDIIKTAVVEEGVTYLGKYSLSGLRNLESVELPQSLKTMGDGVFDGCASLKKIVIPSGVNDIGNGVFEYCASLERVSLPKGMPQIGSGFFQGCRSLKSIELPSMLTAVGERAFNGCASLKEIKLPMTVKKIGEQAFKDCASIEEMELPPAINEINNQLFSGCTSLRHVSVPIAVKNVGSEAFADCVSLEEIKLPDTVEIIGGYAFQNCRSIKSMQLPDGIRSIGCGGFDGCISLSYINIPVGVSRLEFMVFNNCTSLKALKLHDNIAYIDWKALSNVPVEELYIGKSVTYIDIKALTGCTMLKKVVVSEENPYYCCENGAIYNKEKTFLLLVPLGSGKTSFTIPASVNRISDMALVGESGLEKISVEDGNTVYWVSDNALYAPRDSVNFLPDNEKGDVLLYYPVSDSRREFTVPDSVGIIYSGVFDGCKNLEVINIGKNTDIIYTDISVKKLKAINVDRENAKFNSVDGVLYSSDDYLYIYPAAKVGKYVFIPEKVEFCAEKFTDCKELVGLSMPGTYASAESDLQGCDRLTRLNVKRCSGFFDLPALRSVVCESFTAYGCVRTAPINYIVKKQRGMGVFPDGVEIPAIIEYGEPSTVVSRCVKDKVISLNGKEISAYGIGGVYYVNETDIEQCGYALSWDGEKRITTVSAPENPEWGELKDGGDKSVTDIVSSDIKFMLDGFVLPSLNTGCWESIIEINALAGERVY